MGREGWRKGARLKERGASRVYTGQVFRFHGIIKGSRATWNSISSAVVDDGTSWDVPRMCFFSSFLPFFLFSSREEGWRILSLIWDCRACWEGEIRKYFFIFQIIFNWVNFERFWGLSIFNSISFEFFEWTMKKDF